jgi:hypothetical protein
MTHLRTPTAVLWAGLLIMVWARAAVPGVSPLFDGVFVADPYLYLSPPPGGDGSPTSAAETLAVDNGSSPAFAVYTGEDPPQAELMGHGGELALQAGSRYIRVTIDPLAPPATLSTDQLAGNVYRFAVSDQTGNVLALTPGQTLTIAMRGPAGLPANAAIARLENGSWRAQTTSPSGLPDFLLTNITALGDYAILGSIAATPSGESPILLIVALVVAAALGLLAWRGEVTRRSAPVKGPRAGPEAARAGQSGPSRRKRRNPRDRR